MTQVKHYLSIFSASTLQERLENFETYWDFTRQHSGELLESEQDLTKKRAKLDYFRANPVKLNHPFAQPELFYRNYVTLQDDVQSLDRKTLLLTCIYKFARHEWVGITGAWSATPNFANSKSVTDRISRFHLAEEFSHTRLFYQMFLTFNLTETQWVPLSPAMQKVYEFFSQATRNFDEPLCLCD
jgi:hypothetical protein